MIHEIFQSFQMIFIYLLILFSSFILSSIRRHRLDIDFNESENAKSFIASQTQNVVFKSEGHLFFICLMFNHSI